MTLSIAVLAVAVLPGHSPGQVNPPLSNGTSTAAQASQQARQPVSTVLMNDVDAGHTKVGDAVKVRIYSGFLTPGGARIPPGSVMTGHVTDVSKLGKGSIESRLAVVFDGVQLSSGQTVPVHMGIAGLAAAPRPVAPETQFDMSAENETPFPGSRPTGVNPDPRGQRTTPNTTGGMGGRRVTRSMPDLTSDPRYTSPNGAGSPAPQDRVNAVARVGSTVPGIELKPSLATQTTLVSTAYTITLRSGTPLVLLSIVEPQ